MSIEARRVLDAICTGESFTPAMVIPLQRFGDFTEDLNSAIEQASTERRWGCVCRLIWVAQRFPNQSLVPVLVRLLDAREDDTYLEAIVDALALIPANEAVESLSRALSYRLPGDDLAFHFNKKVIVALSAIGSDAAIAGIKEAINSREEPIRDFAAATLERLNWTAND